jgi:hypothetical protein
MPQNGTLLVYRIKNAFHMNNWKFFLKSMFVQKKIKIKCVKAASNVKYVQLLDALKEYLQVCNIESFE